MGERAVEHEAATPGRSASPAPAPSPPTFLELARHAGNAAVVRLLQRDETAEWVDPWASEFVELGLKDEILT